MSSVNGLHNKTTLTDSDQMAYIFQTLNGEAKKQLKVRLGTTGNSYPAALETLKSQSEPLTVLLQLS